MKTYVFWSTITSLREISAIVYPIEKTIAVILGMPLTKERLIWMLKPSVLHSDTTSCLQEETSRYKCPSKVFQW